MILLLEFSAVATNAVLNTKHLFADFYSVRINVMFVHNHCIMKESLMKSFQICAWRKILSLSSERDWSQRAGKRKIFCLFVFLWMWRNGNEMLWEENPQFCLKLPCLFKMREIFLEVKAIKRTFLKQIFMTCVFVGEKWIFGVALLCYQLWPAGGTID